MSRRMVIGAAVAATVLTGFWAGPGFGQERRHPAIQALDLVCRGVGSVDDQRTLRDALSGQSPSGRIGPFSFSGFAPNITVPLRTDGGVEVNANLVQVPGEPVAGCLIQMFEQPGHRIDHRALASAFDDWSRDQSPRFERGMRAVEQDGGGHASTWVRDRAGVRELVALNTYPGQVAEAPNLILLFAIQ